MSEDSAEQCRGHLLVGFGYHGEQVADEVHPAALAAGSLEPPLRNCGETAVSVGDDQAHTAEAALAQRSAELLPELLALAVAGIAAQYSRLPSAVTPVATTVAMEPGWLRCCAP